jgi:hypothetical protein
MVTLHLYESGYMTPSVKHWTAARVALEGSSRNPAEVNAANVASEQRISRIATELMHRHALTWDAQSEDWRALAEVIAEMRTEEEIGHLLSRPPPEAIIKLNANALLLRFSPAALGSQLRLRQLGESAEVGLNSIDQALQSTDALERELCTVVDNMNQVAKHAQVVASQARHALSRARSTRKMLQAQGHHLRAVGRSLGASASPAPRAYGALAAQPLDISSQNSDFSEQDDLVGFDLDSFIASEGFMALPHGLDEEEDMDDIDHFEDDFDPAQQK